MKGKIGFVMFVVGASGLAESANITQALISITMLVISTGLIFWEVNTIKE